LPDLVSGRFDRIVCVDAVYHLGPRAPLLRAARTRLFAGGGLAYTDLVLDGAAASAAGRRAVLRVGAGLSGVAFAEVHDSGTALEQLREAGFDEVGVTRLDEAVLDGFCTYATRQARRLGLAARASLAWRRVAATAWLIRLGRDAGLGYALYTGRVAEVADTPDAPGTAAAPEEAKGANARTAAFAASIAPTTTSAERTALSSKGMPGWA
jgi:hypothetical protein